MLTYRALIFGSSRLYLSEHDTLEATHPGVDGETIQQIEASEASNARCPRVVTSQAAVWGLCR